MKIPFYRHTINKGDIDNVVDVLNSQFITTSNVTKAFEEKFANYTNNRFCVGVNSATAGLHLSLIANNIGVGDEVITTPLTFVSTVNVIEMVGATPVFVDVDSKTGLIDLDKIANKITNKTKAIIPVHLYGNMVNIKQLREIIGDRDIKIIEDSAHCVEGDIENIQPGNYSDCAVFSFYATKNLTCGEGGAIVCNNKDIYERVKVLRLHGLSKDAMKRYEKFSQYDVAVLGYKYNMYDIQSALLVDQLDRLDDNWNKREKIYKKYVALFQQLGINYPEISSNTKSAYHLAVMWIDEKIRDELLQFLEGRGVGVSVHFKPVHTFSYYKDRYKFFDDDYPEANKIYKQSISLPLFPSLSSDEFDYIASSIKDFFK